MHDPKHLIGTSDQFKSIDPNGDVVEMKAAWMIVNKEMAAGDFITTQAIVPELMQDTKGNISLDPKKTSQVTVALIALHLAFTRPNHPEMIWASFEHVASDGLPDLAPVAQQNPSDTAPAVLKDPGRSYLLFAKGSTVDQSNNGRKKLTYDMAKRAFTGSTPIFRIYPHPKVGKGSDSEDGAVVSLNGNVRTAFEANKPVNDARYHYRLVARCGSSARMIPRPASRSIVRSRMAMIRAATTKPPCCRGKRQCRAWRWNRSRSGAFRTVSAATTRRRSKATLPTSRSSMRNRSTSRT